MSLVAILGPEPARRVMRSIAETLRRAGHDVFCYAKMSEMLEDPRWGRTSLLISFGVPCGAAHMGRAPALRAIVSPLVGIEWIDMPAASARDILVVNGQLRENRESLAEATFMLILVALYDLHAVEALMGDPNGPRPMRRMLRGKTVGIIGFGGIAQELIARLQGWHVTIQVHNRTIREHAGIPFVPLDQLLATSDIIVVLSSLNPSSHHLLDESRLAHIKEGAILVNTARGGLIDEAALVACLKSGRIAKAMLDVFETEPLPADSPLRALPNVVLTPHAIGQTRELIEALPIMAAQNAIDILCGVVPASCQNPEIIDRWRTKS